MVLYFSGTGNTKYIAKLISDKIGESLYSINDAMRNNEQTDFSSEKVLVVLMPVYAWQAPKVVMEWFAECKFKCGQEIYFILTCGGEMSDSAKYLEIFCRDRDLKYMGTKEVIMPDNYIIMFEAPKESQSAELIKKATRSIDGIVNVIKSNLVFEPKPVNFMDKAKSGFINKMFNKYYIGSKAFYAEDTCIACGKCVELCPLANISMDSSKPVWGKTCTHCMACISYCPKTAIEYGKKTKGKKRYYFK